MRAPPQQRRSNAHAADAWSLYQGHRERVLEHALRDAGGALCVLGAGNANDLDLVRLATAYDEVHLVDIDDDALARGVRRVPPEARRRVRLHGGVDLSGLSASLAGLDGVNASERVHAGAARVARGLGPGRFRTVVSDCLLTQMNTAFMDRLRSRAAGLTALLTHLAPAHLRLLVELAAPGGRAILVTDVASSDAYPMDDVERDPTAAAPLLEHLVELGLFYPGTNPTALRAAVRADPVMRARVTRALLHQPWLWRALPDRAYLVYALELQITLG